MASNQVRARRILFARLLKAARDPILASEVAAVDNGINVRPVTIGKVQSELESVCDAILTDGYNCNGGPITDDDIEALEAALPGFEALDLSGWFESSNTSIV